MRSSSIGPSRSMDGWKKKTTEKKTQDDEEKSNTLKGLSLLFFNIYNFGFNTSLLAHA